MYESKLLAMMGFPTREWAQQALLGAYLAVDANPLLEALRSKDPTLMLRWTSLSIRSEEEFVVSQKPNARKCRIDLVARTDEALIGIECKVGAKERAGQLADYATVLGREAEGRKVVLVFLTEDGARPDYQRVFKTRFPEIALISLHWSDLTLALDHRISPVVRDWRLAREKWDEMHQIWIERVRVYPSPDCKELLTKPLSAGRALNALAAETATALGDEWEVVSSASAGANGSDVQADIAHVSWYDTCDSRSPSPLAHVENPPDEFKLRNPWGDDVYRVGARVRFRLSASGLELGFGTTILPYEPALGRKTRENIQKYTRAATNKLALRRQSIRSLLAEQDVDASAGDSHWERQCVLCESPWPSTDRASDAAKVVRELPVEEIGAALA